MQVFMDLVVEAERLIQVDKQLPSGTRWTKRWNMVELEVQHPNAFGTSGESSSPFYYFSGGGGGGIWSNIGSYPSATVGSGGLGGGGDAECKSRTKYTKSRK